MTKRWMWFLFLVLLLSACGQQEDKNGKSLAVSDGNVARDSLVVVIEEEPSNGFDPTVDWGDHGVFLFHNALVKTDADFNIRCDLAESFDISEDGKVYRFVLRPEILFSDGQPLTAEDIVFTFKKAKKTNTYIDFSNLLAIEAQGDRHVTFTLYEPQSTFLNDVARQGIVPAHAYEEENYARNPIGTGPYQLLQWDIGQQVITGKNPYYKKAELPFEVISFVFLGVDAALAAAKNGTVDSIPISPDLAGIDISGMKLHRIESCDVRGISFPTRPPGEIIRDDGALVGNAVTSELAIRKAVNLALDREALVAGVLKGYGKKVVSESESVPWGNAEVRLDDGQAEPAKAILEKAGWVDEDGDGVREKQGQNAEFTLLFPAGDRLRQSLAIVVAEQLKPVGIHVQPEGRSWEEIARRMYETPLLFATGDREPMEVYRIYSSELAGHGWNNIAYYQNPQADELFHQALAANTSAEANHYWQSAQWTGKNGISVLGDAPWAWLVQVEHLYFINDQLDIGDPEIDGHGHGWQIARNIEEWKWKESEQFQKRSFP